MRMTRTVARAVLSTLVAAILCSSALAQIDAQSQALLDGLWAGGSAEPLESIDQTVVTTMYMNGEEMVTSSRTVIDYVNRRAAIFTDMGGGMMTRMIHVDGVTTMKMEGMPMALPVPPQMSSAFDSIFDQPQTVAQDPNATAVYDGEVSYGDVISGRQVTYTATYDGTPMTSKMIFDDAGAYVGMVMDGEDGSTIVMVFDEPVSGSGPNEPRAMSMYDFRDGVATLTSRTTYENVSVNQPLDETVFE